MGKSWEGKYKFEMGEEVRIREGHPFSGRKGIVQSLHGDEQFGVLLTDGREVAVFADALELLPIAAKRRRREKPDGGHY